MQQPKVFIKSLWYRLSGWRFSQHQQLLQTARQRTLSTTAIACVAFITIAVRLVDVMIIRTSACPTCYQQQEYHLRQNITDRNGIILATQLITASVYANPKVIINAKEAADKLHKLFPHLKYDALLQKLKSNQGFIWIERHVSPKMQDIVHSMGIPGVYLQQDQKRVYPHGQLACHVIGRCDIDGYGISGIEQAFDQELSTKEGEFKLSLDIRVQHAVHNELVEAVAKFRAVAANATVMNVKTGEIVAMVSLPDYDSNRQMKNLECGFNRNTLGVYEQGSTFKVINAAIALETGVVNPHTIVDATNPVHIGRFKITDFKGENRPLTIVEALVHSSNIAAIKIAQKFGPDVQRHFLSLFGVTQPLSLEVPELGKSMLPKLWRETAMMSVSFGYGIAVTPLHSLCAIAAIVNNGSKPLPTLRFVAEENREARIKSFSQAPCVSEKTSKIIRQIMRMVVVKGTAKKANVDGYHVFAKTGTAYQNKGKFGYGSDANRHRTTSFIGGFPANDPQYVMIIMLDDPQPVEGTYGYATAGWNVTPTTGKIIERIAPMLGVHSNFDDEVYSEIEGNNNMRLTALKEESGDH